MALFSNDRFSCDPVERSCQTPDRTEDGTGTYGFAVWGLWISFGWLLGHESARAAPVDHPEVSPFAHDQNVPRRSEQHRPDSDASSHAAGKLHENDAVEPTSVVSHPSLATTPHAVGMAPVNSQSTDQVSNASKVDAARMNDAASHAVGNPYAPIAAQPVFDSSVTGSAVLQEWAPLAPGQPATLDIMTLPQLSSFLPPGTIGTGWLGHSLASTFEESLTVIAGDYYDLQISYDFGTYEMIGPPLHGTDISFGSVLYSPASEYDLVVVNQNLIELNLIVQLNVGVGSAANSGMQSQANEAAIVSFSDAGAHQVTAGDFLNIAAVQQLNFLAGSNHASQHNDAAILDLAPGIDPANGPLAQTIGSGSDPFGLRSVDEAGQDFSTLYVTGTYYEVNLIFQMAVAALEDGSSPQFNHAVIYDFEDVGLHQFVGGDEYDVDAILQANIVSQPDQPATSPIAALIPQSVATAVQTGDAAGHIAPAVSATAPVIAGPTIVPVQNMGMQSGELVGDLMA